MYISFDKPEEALKKYFNYYFNGLKIGLVTSITGSPFLKTGTGKSWTAGKLGEILDKDFSIDKVVYYPKEFLQVADKIEEIGKPAQVMVTDEGEITAPAYMYYSFTNKSIFYSLATFRVLRAMNIQVTPSFMWLDKRIRTLVSHWGYTEKSLKANRTVVKLKLYRVKTDLFGEKIYFNKITMFNKEIQRLVTFKDFIVSPPSEEFQVAYEKKAYEFKSNLRKRLIPELEKWEAYQFAEETKDIHGIVNEIAGNKEIINQLVTQRGRLDIDLIKEKYPKLKFSEAKRVKRLVEKLWSGG
jgi:hypothetical protein